MESTRELLHRIFQVLNAQMEELQRQRMDEGLALPRRARIRLLGQLSLLSRERVSAILSLAQTGDLDAFLDMEHATKEAFKSILLKNGLVYDEDSHLVWIPPGTAFEPLFDFKHVQVESIDSESALVSKAVKAPAKNRQLIREAIASNAFPRLVDRILSNGGKLEEFA